jgi:hypothetical protein
MSSYSGYNPQANPRAAMRQRLLQLMAQRARYENEQRAQAEQERQQALAMAKMDEEGQLNSMYGAVGQGAMTGGMIGGPWGAAIGGGAGLLLGGLGEMQQRKAYGDATGKKGYGYGDALKDTFARAPSVNEFSRLAGGAGAGLSGVAADYRAQGELERYMGSAQGQRDQKRQLGEAQAGAQPMQAAAMAEAERRRKPLNEAYANNAKYPPAGTGTYTGYNENDPMNAAMRRASEATNERIRKSGL